MWIEGFGVGDFGIGLTVYACKLVRVCGFWGSIHSFPFSNTVTKSSAPYTRNTRHCTTLGSSGLRTLPELLSQDPEP